MGTRVEAISGFQRGDCIGIIARSVPGHAERSKQAAVHRNQPAGGLRLPDRQAQGGRLGPRLADHEPTGTIEPPRVFRRSLRQGQSLLPEGFRELEIGP